MPTINNPHSSVASEANSTVPSELRRYLDQAGRVVIWPAKRAIRMQIYAYLAALFQPGRVYSEKEVNQLLALYLVCNDHVMVRCGLCDFRYLSVNVMGHATGACQMPDLKVKLRMPRMAPEAARGIFVFWKKNATTSTTTATHLQITISKPA